MLNLDDDIWVFRFYTAMFVIAALAMLLIGINAVSDAYVDYKQAFELYMDRKL